MVGERSTHKVATFFYCRKLNTFVCTQSLRAEKTSALGELIAPHVPAIIRPGTLCFLGPNRGKMTRLTNSELKRRNEMFAQGMLWCCECKQFHPVKDFVKDRSVGKSQANYGYRKYCIRCNKAQYIRKRDKTSQFYKERNAALKARFVELAGGKCHRCGYNAFNAALDFHHVYPSQKKYNPTHIIYSGNFEKAWRELDKCCLICHNCHTTYEAGMWRAEFIKRDGLGYTIGADLPLDDNRYEIDKPPKLQQAPLPLFAYGQTSTQLSLL